MSLAKLNDETVALSGDKEAVVPSGFETVAFQIIAFVAGLFRTRKIDLCDQIGRRPCLRDKFCELIPRRPYCANLLEGGLIVRKKKIALSMRHLQWNDPWAFRWMMHDIDRSDAYFAHRDANLPEPNIIILNPSNGHAHVAYQLENPVACHSTSRDHPLRFYSAVERGVGRRLGADPHYRALIAKNPLHPSWNVEWRREDPFTLNEIADWLFKRDMRPELTIEATAGAGRNVTVFDELRRFAYAEVRKFKSNGVPFEVWLHRCTAVASDLNSQFVSPMSISEVKSIAKSVARWVWKKFSIAAFRERQSRLGVRGNAKRWDNHERKLHGSPWVSAGRLTIAIKSKTVRLWWMVTDNSNFETA